ncbi:YqaJ viral recombinase family protein [Aerococcaceae bacterium DSM 111020]|nr:YqaJ viral recombinase family protein [Aerococcaceae bacterium DSM 111020]
MVSANKYSIATTDKEWHALRSKGLGGSDIGTLMGLNSYKSKYELWLEKTKRVQSPDISDRIAIQVGNELEDLVARIFSQETGLRVQKDNKTHYHKDHDFLLANIDRKIIGEKALLECKTASAFLADQWKEDEVPASYLLQVQHYLNVLDYDYAYIAVIIGNHDFVYKKIDRDQELIDLYQAEAVRFWNENILKDVEPEIEGLVTKQAINYISNRIESGKSMEATEEQKKSIENIRYYKKQIKELKEQQNKFEDQLKASMAIAGAEVVEGDGFKATYKQYTQNRLDSSRLKKELPDVAKEYTKEIIANRLTIK